MSGRFRIKDRTRRQSHEMIQMMAKHSNNLWTFGTDADVKRFFASRGYDYADVVQRCRKANARAPLGENIIKSTWAGFGPGTVLSIVNLETGEEMATLEEPGLLAMSTYWQLFENAVDRFRECLKTGSLGSFQSWLSSGIASIDAYIMHQASLYSSRHPTEQLVDSKEQKVPFKTKIDMWIPTMSGDKKLDKGRQNWHDSQTLRDTRHEWAIHTKKPSLAITDADLREFLNLFRSGIAGLLVDLHLLFGERIPSIIVKYAYLGDIELIKEESP